MRSSEFGGSFDLFFSLFQLIVEISSVSSESLNYCTTSGLVTQLLRELTGEDVLVRCVDSDFLEINALFGVSGSNCGI